MTCDPKSRKVLLTDGNTAIGRSLVRALLGAGADLVWVGHSGSRERSPALSEIASLPGAVLTRLDLTDSHSIQNAAAELGAKVDILINTGEVHAEHGVLSDGGVEGARAEMEVNYFGLLRLAQAFGPMMCSRGAHGRSSVAAWVNVLSIYALMNSPPQGTFCASKAAALSLSQCLRAKMQPHGVRVINVFPGPLDDEVNRALPPPKITPDALANSILMALKGGIEDVYPGDVAQQWLARWRESPKTLERELSA